MKTIKNDGSMLFYIVRHVKEIAKNMDWQTFVNWYTIKMIIPYSTESGKDFLASFYKAIGFKKEPDMGKVYLRLKELQIH